MAYNYFALTRERQTQLPPFYDGRVKIEVKGNAEGVATIWDKELILYLASLVQAKVNRGETPDQVITFRANDYHSVTGSQGGGSAYEVLHGTLKRLKGTTVYTNQFLDEDGMAGLDSGFSWIDDYKIHWVRRNGSKDRVMSAVCVTLSKVVFEAIRRGILLTYNRDYFSIKSPIERRLYEVARAHCGDQLNGFRIGLEKLRLRIGSDREPRKFKSDLVKLSQRSRALPDYGLVVLDGNLQAGEGPRRRTPLHKVTVYFYRTAQLAKIPAPLEAVLVD